MFDALLNLIPGGGLAVLGAILVAVLGLLGWGARKVHKAGENEEKARTAQAERLAAERRHSMAVEAKKAELVAAGLSEAEARKEAMRWVRQR